MPVITLSREFGSGGDEVAAAVARRMHLRLVNREIVNQAARETGVPEVALAEIDDLGLLGLKPPPAAWQQYREIMAGLMHRAADEGNVLFLGRGSQVVLAGRSDALHVRIIAPLEMRVQRVAEAGRMPSGAARALIEARDKARIEFLRRHYGARWDDPALYDLTVNTARVSTSAAAALLCSAADPLQRPQADPLQRPQADPLQKPHAENQR